MTNSNESPSSLSDSQFGTELAELTPHLRAFGRSIVGNADRADDLVQETMVKAWAARQSFKKGTSMRAWTFTILRNTWLSEMRRAKFVGEYDELAAERQLQHDGNQGDKIDLQDVERAMQLLPDDQREALVLVGGAGMAYAEAAEIADCAVGTMKSRVSRGRTQLTKILEGEDASSAEEAPALSKQAKKRRRFNVRKAIDRAIGKLPEAARTKAAA